MAYVHECCLHTGKNPDDPSTIYVSQQFPADFSLNMQLHDKAVYYKGDSGLVWPGINNDFIGHGTIYLVLKAMPYGRGQNPLVLLKNLAGLNYFHAFYQRVF